MEQKNIRPYDGQTYSIEEGAKIIKELDDRTKSSKIGLNTIDLLAEAIIGLQYVTPKINSFTNSVDQVRMGKTITDVTLNWALNKAVTSQSINQGVGVIAPELRTKALTGQSISADITYTLTVGDGTNTVTANTTISFLNDRFWGVSANATLPNAQVLALSSELSGSRAKSFSQNGGGKYIYYAWPKRLGAISNMNVNGLSFTAYTVVEQSVTNAEGFAEAYYILRTNTVQNGTLNISIS